MPSQHMALAARDLLASACLAPGCDALEIRYVAEPIATGRAAVHMFVTTMSRSVDPHVPAVALDAASRALPKGFKWSAPGSAIALADEADRRVDAFEVVLELRRPEGLTHPEWDYIPSDFYYVLDDVAGDASGWQRLSERLASVSSRVEVSLLFAQTDVTVEERQVLGSVMTGLARFGQARTEYDIVGNPISYPPCENARLALLSWQARVERLIRPVLGRVAVRGEVEIAAHIAAAVASALSARTDAVSASPCFVEAPQNEADRRQASFGFNWLEVLPWGGHPVWTYEDVAPHSLRRLPYLFGIDEAASVAYLPVPDEDGVAGMAVARGIETRRDPVKRVPMEPPGPSLGVHLDEGRAGRQFTMPLSALTRHMLVVGSPGSGKTTTVHSLLADLWRKYRVPFAVLESAKTEYRTLLDVPGLEDLQVFTLGREDVSPFRLNPLAPPPGVRCETHIGSVLASLRLAMPLFPPLPQLLAKALDRAYAEAGWDDHTTAASGVSPPTLRSLLDSFETVFESAGYVGEARDLAAAMRVRLEGLLRGSVGRLLDTVESVDFSGLMERPVVFELEHVSDPEERAVVAAFILDRIRCAAKGRGNTSGELRHLTVVEEAHRLLGTTESHRGGDSTDPRSDAIRAFIEAIAEVRALGEGFVLSSQQPSQLAPSAVGNTGIRVIHRLESATDRNCMLDDLGARDEEREVAARLRVGEAVVRLPGWDDAGFVLIEPPADVDSGRKVGDDLIAIRMADLRSATQTLVPYAFCSEEVCPRGCTLEVRQRGRASGRRIGDEAEATWKRHEGSASALPEIVALVISETGPDLRQAYCACTHLSAERRALTVGGKDIRGQLTLSLRNGGALQ